MEHCSEALLDPRGDALSGRADSARRRVLPVMVEAPCRGDTLYYSSQLYVFFDAEINGEVNHLSFTPNIGESETGLPFLNGLLPERLLCF